MNTPPYFLAFEEKQRFPISDDKAIANGFRGSLSGQTVFDEAVYAELYAFTLYENSQYGLEKWRSYFGPAATLFEGGIVSEEIRFEKITPAVIEYWERRMVEAQHPVLVSRYAGLVWEFSNKVRKQKPLLSVALTYLENLLSAASTDYYAHVTLIFRKLARVLDLAVKLKQEEIKMKAITSIRELEVKVGELAKPGLWKYSFELLVRNPSIGIDDALKQKIINELEARLLQATTTIDGMPANLNAAVAAADYLTEYYRKIKSPADQARVLKVLHTGYESAEAFANAAMIIHQLEMLYERYILNGMQPEADQVLTKIRSHGPRLMAEMKVVQAPMEMSMEIVDRLIDMIYSGDETDALRNLADGFIQTADEAGRDERSIADMIQKSLYDHTGRKVSTVGAIDADAYGNIMTLMGRSMTLMSGIIQFILKAGRDKGIIEPNAMMRTIAGCIWFDPLKHAILNRAFLAYQENDPIVFLHLAVPQVEAACLKMFEQHGGQIWKEGKNGGYHVRLLDDVLRDKAFSALVSEKVSLYLRAVFTDQRGWNLRNNIAHGMVAGESLTTEKADRVFLVLLLLCFLKLESNHT